jgi:hypothetical protein
MYAPQLTVPGLAQAPVPVQNAGGVKVVPLHDGFPHWTVVAPCAQPPNPLQKPVLPQGGLGVQAAAEVPAGRLTHIPPVPQTWQVGQLATPQQTPSVQSPVPHSSAVPQAAPLAFLGRQLPPGPEQ